MLQQEKRNLYDQISAADELKKQQQVHLSRRTRVARRGPVRTECHRASRFPGFRQDLTQRLRSQLALFSTEEVERKIKALEHQQQASTHRL